MAEINNFSEITENFDTIKTLLNSIRAQGILNTSDVDKLLAGINSKLEKLNTEEDIDLIKIFLSELKQNLDERHNVLVSKFGAIESLFSNLLKNSSDSLKSSEAKELFDIVATNLSVFSREVVSQKEALTDITLRLDAMRSDDSQKKDILKSISLLKTDMEHLSNGFDSIVLSLNENFKALINRLSEIDQSDAIKGFDAQLTDVVNSSNTILSALQMIDKKNLQIEDSIKVLATQEDIGSTKKWLSDLTAKNHELTTAIDGLADKYYKIDNLAEKIDASVNIIAGLKSLLADNNQENTQLILDRLIGLENSLNEISANKSFEDFKTSLEDVLKDISSGSLNLQNAFVNASDEIQKINNNIKSLDININFQNVVTGINKSEQGVKDAVDAAAGKLSQLIDVNITRTLNDISSSTDILNARLKESQLALTGLCEKNFNEVVDNVENLRTVISQIDENIVSANNAIFSNITDRLAIFENSLKTSLDKQEDTVSNTSAQLFDQINNIKNLTGVIDYKLDASVIEINNSKREFSDLKSSVQEMLALDFVNVVKDLKVDLYAAKGEISSAIEASTNDLSDKFSNDLFGKYELLISRLDNVEDELKQAQLQALNNIKPVLENISSSIVDVLSYVSEKQNINLDGIDVKLANITEAVKENNLNYVENVRDIVEVIRTQVENSLIKLQNDSSEQIAGINLSIEKSNEELKEQIKYSYNKLLEVQDKFDELNNVLTLNNTSLNTSIDNMTASADKLQTEFDNKLIALKNSLLAKIDDFRQEFTCENADKISELKFSSENLFSKNLQNTIDLNNELKSEISEKLKELNVNFEDCTAKLTDISLSMENSNKDFSQGLELKINGVTEGLDKLDSSINSLSASATNSLTSAMAQLLDNFVSLKALMNSLNDKTAVNIRENIDVLTNEIEKLTGRVNEVDTAIDEDFTHQLSILEHSFEILTGNIAEFFKNGNAEIGERLNAGLTVISGKVGESVTVALEKYKGQVEALFDDVAEKSEKQGQFIKNKVLELNSVLNSTLDKQNQAFTAQLQDIAANLKSILDENIEVTSADYDSLKLKLSDFSQKLEKSNQDLIANVKAQLDDMAKFVDSGLDIQAQEVSSKFDEISSKMQNVSAIVTELNNDVKTKVSGIKTDFDNMKSGVVSSISENTVMVLNRLENLLNDLTAKGDEVASSLIVASADIKGDIKTSVSADIHDVTALLDAKFKEIDELLENTSYTQQNNTLEQAKSILEELKQLQEYAKSQLSEAKDYINSSILSETASLYDKVQALFEEHSLNFVTQLANTGARFSDDLNTNLLEFKTLFEVLNERMDKDEVSRMNVFQAQLKELSKTFNILIEEAKNVTKSEVSAISEVLINNSKVLMEDVEQSIEEKVNSILASNADISAGELQTMEAFANKILAQLDVSKQNSTACKDIIIDLVKKEFDEVANNIEKETDIIVKDLLEQFNLLRDGLKDELSNLSVHIESSIEDYIYNYINDLKSYLDVKTDSSIVNHKLDNLRSDLERSVEDVLGNINKLLEANVFASALSDFKTANEILITSMSEKLNKQIQDFIENNVSKKFEDKLALFDKKFIDTVVDKYEEVKLISSRYNNSFESIQVYVQDLVAKFTESKNEIHSGISSLVESINNSISELGLSFADLKAQILNKSFDEAFQASLNNQISGIENLVSRQLGYLEDISELCCNNLPELTEMNALVKYGIQQSVQNLTDNLNSKDVLLEKELNSLKSDIITQFINVFNQISFVAEQEEILDFIQEKHSELITILSHIVTTVDTVENVKDNIVVVDNKIDLLKDDISNLNNKINSIISSNGDINYIYSLQDLESDIANLRLVLNDMKEDNKSKEFEELISSTNEIYKLVESIKAEMPKFELEEFKRDFSSLSEDIVSISTRTNKLILASDESYKTLQENLQDFKLVINDLDERTRNFAHEAGIDRIDNKLGAINTMIQNGAKTNQVFNQVFEYLAEWVDNAGAQITAISDKVETLDDIGQIKVMLEDLKAEAEDNTDSAELIEALSNVFEKQAKRISSLEAKLDRVIVETTISNKNNKIDMTPLEETLNRFLVAMDDKMTSQQSKIDMLESKLEEAMALINPKDTQQLTKKVGGMDRQIAKLNKSIEKIASHVVEK